MKFFKLYLFLFFIALIQIKSYALSNKVIDDLAQAFMKENQVEGMSIAVLSKDKTRIYNYGMANKPQNIPVTNDTIYTIGSFTKTFTALLSAIASVEGKLDLDASFNRYFPELKNAQNLDKITCRELLAHVATFPFNFTPPPETYADVLRILNNYQPKRAPGKEYSYSNAGIGIMGYVLQNLYETTYQNILDTEILKPLTMQSTYLVIPREKEKYIALGHDKNNKPVPYSKNSEIWFAAASLKSTISDMAKYLRFQFDSSAFENTNLSKALSMVHTNNYCFADKISCEELAWQAHVMPAIKYSVGDTYFIDFDSSGNPTFDKKEIINNPDFNTMKIFIDKTGSGYGMSSYMIYIPDEKTGVVLLMNKWIGDERIKLGRTILRKLSFS